MTPLRRAVALEKSRSEPMRQTVCAVCSSLGDMELLKALGGQTILSGLQEFLTELLHCWTLVSLRFDCAFALVIPSWIKEGI